MQFSQSPSAALFYFLESHLWPKISSLSRVIVVLGKSRSHRAPNLGYRGAESPGWLNVLPKISAWDVMHEWAYCPDEAANHQLPMAVVFWIIQIVSTEEYSKLMQNLIQIKCSTCSVILNAMATQCTCSLDGFYLPPLTGTVKLSLFIHAHSSPVALAVRLHPCRTKRSRNINNGWTFTGQTSIYKNNCLKNTVEIMYPFSIETKTNSQLWYIDIQ